MTVLSSEQAVRGASAMTMTPRLRKFALTAHVTFSVGWLGAVVAYLALAIAALTSKDAQVVRTGYLAMELIGWFVIVPLSLAALLTGLVQSLGTEWGLFRHYWILVKLLLTIGAITILLLHMPAVRRMSGAKAEVIHAGGGLLVLLAATTLSVYKPWGKTWYGRRKSGLDSDRESTTSTPWGLYVLLGIIFLILLLVLLHLTGGSHGGH
jgi:acid phosphatase family membrane protein YuiD